MNAVFTSTRSLAAYSKSQGVSEEARETQRRIANLLGGLYNTESLGKPITSALNALEEVLEECSEDNWDGYEASSVTIDSYLEAKRFLRALPAGVPTPEVTVEPDGELAFEWYSGRNRVFTVSIGTDGTLTYAGKFGSSKAHGKDFFADEVPGLVMAGLKKLFTLQR